MRTFIVMVVKAGDDGDPPDQVRAYAQDAVDAMRRAMARGEPVTLHAEPGQVQRIYLYDPDTARAEQ